MTPRGRRVARNPSQKKVRPGEGKHTGWGQTMSSARASPVEAGAETSVEKETQRLWGNFRKVLLAITIGELQAGEYFRTSWQDLEWWAGTILLASPKNKGLQPATTLLHLSRRTQASLQATE